ncbi:MAG: TraR/DksA C4-type zinc finger protein [Ilumatobacteraceae bacterium]
MNTPVHTLSDSQQTSMRNKLVQERDAVDGQIAELTRSFDEIVTAVEDTNNDDEHDPEGTTIAFERAQVAALLNQAKADREAVDQALAKLDDGAYGVCEECAEPIGVERLTAIPSAARCIKCA